MKKRARALPPHKKLDEYTRDERDEIMAHIGQMILALPTVSEFARHAHPASTFLDYVDPPEQPMRYVAWCYLRDFLRKPHGMPTAQMIEKWGRL